MWPSKCVGGFLGKSGRQLKRNYGKEKHSPNPSLDNLPLHNPPQRKAPSPDRFPESAAFRRRTIFFRRPVVTSRRRGTIVQSKPFKGALSAGEIHCLRRLRHEGFPECLSQSWQLVHRNVALSLRTLWFLSGGVPPTPAPSDPQKKEPSYVRLSHNHLPHPL